METDIVEKENWLSSVTPKKKKIDINI